MHCCKKARYSRMGEHLRLLDAGSLQVTFDAENEAIRLPIVSHLNSSKSALSADTEGGRNSTGCNSWGNRQTTGRGHYVASPNTRCITSVQAQIEASPIIRGIDDNRGRLHGHVCGRSSTEPTQRNDRGERPSKALVHMCPPEIYKP